ncbi:hypothetical protein FEZ41_01860 [Lentilactobacillus parafarraginis]|jgi:hypothetical protein|nr:hypothetical protein [Lentilactobacillus parafarraginis]TLQ20791.1 hypothetical protein FEZ41_01860 [Lentilactobacillus parafarraginis]
MLKQVIPKIIDALALSAISLATVLFIVKGIFDLSYTGTYPWQQYMFDFGIGMLGVGVLLIIIEMLEYITRRFRE